MSTDSIVNGLFTFTECYLGDDMSTDSIVNGLFTFTECYPGDDMSTDSIVNGFPPPYNCYEENFTVQVSHHRSCNLCYEVKFTTVTLTCSASSVYKGTALVVYSVERFNACI
jgi:hypothetical protein